MLAPGSTIGILGGGQLGRMLALAAARLGFDVHIYADEADTPASRVAARTTVASFDDAAALKAFAAQVGVVTFEFENVPARAAEVLTAAGAPVRPGPQALAAAQDRVDEKSFLLGVGVPTTPFRAIAAEADIAPALAAIGARGVDGAFAAFDVCENVHEHGILHVTRVPSAAPASTMEAAVAMTRTVADALDYVGVLCIEFFVLADGSLLANEMAPRVHNSGHWTESACLTSQFEQHIRAIAGWRLGPTTRLADVEMTNLIGAEADAWASLAADPDVRLHLYGKRDVRDGRKMGHVTKLVRSR